MSANAEANNAEGLGGDEGMVAPPDVIVHGLGCVEDILEVLKDIEQKLDATANRSTRQFNNKTEFDDLVQRLKNGKAKVVLRKIFLYQKNWTVQQEVWIQDKSNPNALPPTGNPYKEYTVVHVHHHDAIASGRVQDVDATKDLDFVDAINARHLAPTGHSYQGDNPFFSTFIEPSNDGASLKVYPHDWKCSVCGQTNFQRNLSCRGRGGRGCKGTPGAEYGRGNLRVDPDDGEAYPLDSFIECDGGEIGRRYWATAAWCWEWKKDKSVDPGLAEILDQADKLKSGMQMLSGKGLPKINKSMTRATGDQPGAGIVTIGMEDLMREYGESRQKTCRKCWEIQCICNGAAPETEASSNSEHLWNDPIWSDLPGPKQPKPPVNILFIGANNSDSAKLSLEREVEAMMTQFMFEHGNSNWGDTVTFEHSCFASKKDLSRDLIRRNPHILHFALHAQKSALELFQHELASRDLVDLMECHLQAPGCNLQLIIINACNSTDIAQSLSKHVDFVIGHHSPVRDEDAVDFSGVMYAYLGAGKDLLHSFKAAKIVSNPYRMIGQKNAKEFRLPSPAGAKAAEIATSKNPVIEFLRGNGLERIAERLSDELGLERPDDLQHVQEKDLDELEWLKKVPKVKLLKLCQEVTANLHSPDSSSQASKAPTPDARSVGSSDGTGFESDRADVLVSTRNVGDSENYKEHMERLLFDFFEYNKFEDVDTEWETFDTALGKTEGNRNSNWTLSMLLWIRFAHDATLDQTLRAKWLHATTHSPNQNYLLSILTECLLHDDTTHPLWTKEGRKCRKKHAAAISFTDSMVKHALRGNENGKKEWKERVVQEWFDTEDEHAEDFLFRANRFLREHSIDGICIFEKVVKTQSYVAFLKMRRLTACILFGYLEVRKLESEAVAGTAGGTGTLLWGFNLFVSSEGHIFNRTNADMHTKSASLAIVKGLQCLVHHLDPGFRILGPFKTAVEFSQRHSRPMASGAEHWLSLKKTLSHDANII